VRICVCLRSILRQVLGISAFIVGTAVLTRGFFTYEVITRYQPHL